MKTTNTKIAIAATGTGKAKLYYNIANSYNIKYEIDTEIEKFKK